MGLASVVDNQSPPPLWLQKGWRASWCRECYFSGGAGCRFPNGQTDTPDSPYLGDEGEPDGCDDREEGDDQSLAQARERLSLIHISEPTRQAEISYAVFCLKK